MLQEKENLEEELDSLQSEIKEHELYYSHWVKRKEATDLFDCLSTALAKIKKDKKETEVALEELQKKETKLKDRIQELQVVEGELLVKLAVNGGSLDRDGAEKIK